VKKIDDRLSIMIVDDVPGNIKTLQAILSENYELFVVTNGYDALEITASESIDLILLDIVMPELDGYEVIRRLKADVATEHIPVIFLTAETRAQDEVKGLKLGAADFMLKPVDPFIVNARIQTQITLIDARKNLQEQNERLEQKVAERTFQLTTTEGAQIEP
jgi:putative two-component system response regulator